METIAVLVGVLLGLGYAYCVWLQCREDRKEKK